LNIIIAGAGKVGFRLAKTLSTQNNIYIIDKNKNALDRLTESIDVMPVFGDIKDPDTYRALKGVSCDIFIAVTDSDESNILSTLIADDIIDVNKKITRLRNPYFAKSTIFQKLIISGSVFPFVLTAQSIKSLLDFPRANNVKSFIFTPYKLISLKITHSQAFKVEHLNIKNITIVGIERKKHFFIPDNSDVIEENDLIYIFGDEHRIKELCKKINQDENQGIKKIAIFGADLLGIEIAKSFINENVDIKIIEKDTSLCKKASEALQDRAMIINSIYIEHTIYEEENIKNADMIIATGNNDEDNIIRCLEAKEYNVKKTVAINNDLEFYNLMHKLGIVAIRGPKINAYYSILEKIDSSNVIVEKHYCGGRGKVFMRRIFPNSRLIGKVIKPIRVDDAVFLFVRSHLIKKFDQKIVLEKDDIIVVFLTLSLEAKVKKWIYNL